MSHTNKNYLIAALAAISLALFMTALYQKSVIKAFTSELKQEIISLENEKIFLSKSPKPVRVVQDVNTAPIPTIDALDIYQICRDNKACVTEKFQSITSLTNEQINGYVLLYFENINTYYIKEKDA